MEEAAGAQKPPIWMAARSTLCNFYFLLEGRDGSWGKTGLV